MRDVTTVLLKQSSEFGRPVRLNVTRIDNYLSMVERIYKLIGEKKLCIMVIAGNRLVEKRTLDLDKAKKLVKWYGKRFFVKITHRNGEQLSLELIGVAPSPPSSSEDDDEKV